MRWRLTPLAWRGNDNIMRDRPVLLQVWLSEEERDMLEKLTQEHGLTQSGMIRLLIRIRAGAVEEVRT